jgi:predicted nucleic acid-binding Zn ribbon protein
MQLPSLASREFPFQPWIVFHSEFPRLHCDNGSAAFPKAARQSRCGSQSRDVLRKKKTRRREPAVFFSSCLQRLGPSKSREFHLTE